MKTKKILLTLVPALVLGGASLAWADPTATLDAILSTDSGVPQKSEMFDCSRPAGHRDGRLSRRGEYVANPCPRHLRRSPARPG